MLCIYIHEHIHLLVNKSEQIKEFSVSLRLTHAHTPPHTYKVISHPPEEQPPQHTHSHIICKSTHTHTQVLLNTQTVTTAFPLEYFPRAQYNVSD